MLQDAVAEPLGAQLPVLGVATTAPPGPVRLVHQVDADHIPRGAEPPGELRPVVENLGLAPLLVVPKAIPAAGPLGVQAVARVLDAQPMAREQHEDAVLRCPARDQLEHAQVARSHQCGCLLPVERQLVVARVVLEGERVEGDILVREEQPERVEALLLKEAKVLVDAALLEAVRQAVLPLGAKPVRTLELQHLVVGSQRAVARRVEVNHGGDTFSLDCAAIMNVEKCEMRN